LPICNNKQTCNKQGGGCIDEFNQIDLPGSLPVSGRKAWHGMDDTKKMFFCGASKACRSCRSAPRRWIYPLSRHSIHTTLTVAKARQRAKQVGTGATTSLQTDFKLSAKECSTIITSRRTECQTMLTE
jgi:hypothetical protein